MRTRRRVEGRPVGHGQNEQIEFLDHEAECNNGNAGAKPGKKSPLIGGVVGIVADHR